MAEQNMTVWQRLSQTFGPNSLLNQDYPLDKLELVIADGNSGDGTKKILNNLKNKYLIILIIRCANSDVTAIFFSL